MTEIVKVQVPLAGAAVGTERCLVYAKGRKHVSEQPIPDAARKALGDDPKGYFNGTWSSIVGWAIADRVKDQDW